jgi:hypothetical protein
MFLDDVAIDKQQRDNTGGAGATSAEESPSRERLAASIR